MDYEFSYNGEIHRVKISREEGDQYSAIIGDKEVRLKATPLSSNQYSILNGNDSIIGYAAENETSFYVHINGHVTKFDKVLDDMSKAASGGDDFGSKDEVSTPMPGKVVKILVSVGDKVTAKQSLVIVESMKMENEIKAPVDSEIKSIHFKDGELVEPGTPIIKLIPLEE
jgi:biotin carboxyl carrier protein